MVKMLSAMKKKLAIELLGGSAAAAADELGCSYQAVMKWPETLPRRIADRVVGVFAFRCARLGRLGDLADFLNKSANIGAAIAPAAIKKEDANG